MYISLCIIWWKAESDDEVIFHLWAKEPRSCKSKLATLKLSWAMDRKTMLSTPWRWQSVAEVNMETQWATRPLPMRKEFSPITQFVSVPILCFFFIASDIIHLFTTCIICLLQLGSKFHKRRYYITSTQKNSQHMVSSVNMSKIKNKWINRILVWTPSNNIVQCSALLYRKKKELQCALKYKSKFSLISLIWYKFD